MSERKIIVYVATSADGFIARKDGNVDWLNRPRTAGDYGMRDFMKSVDTILLGRKTYDWAINFGGGRAFGKKTKYYVFSRKPPSSTSSAVEFVKKPIKEFATQLRDQKGKDIWMMGGGSIIASFLDAGEIDEFIVHVIPVFIGEGIHLIKPHHRNIELNLIESHPYDDGVVKLHYGVRRPDGAF